MMLALTSDFVVKERAVLVHVSMQRGSGGTSGRLLSTMLCVCVFCELWRVRYIHIYSGRRTEEA